MKKSEFLQCMVVLSAGMQKEIPEPTLNVWMECLSDLTAEQLRSAVFQFLNAGDDWPTVHKLRRFAGVRPSEPAIEDRAERAWLAVHEAIVRVGGYESVDFDDAVCNAVVRSLGGWETFSGVLTENLKWLKRDFLAAYRSLSATGVSAELAAPLPGILESTNAWPRAEPLSPRLVECGLPRKPGLVTGERPKRLEHRPEVRRLAESAAVPTEPVKLPTRPERPAPKTEAELEQTRQNFRRQLEAMS